MLVAIVLLALVGLYIALYFTLVTYRVLRPDTRLVPFFCRMEEGVCASIVTSPYARALLGVPNSLLGVVYYAALLVGVATGLLAHPVLLTALRVVALLTVALGVYLTHALLFVLRTPCPLCLASHAINLALALLLLAR
ncbi:MAG TPA: vitamin K epoxide reductase family protein [Chloroflexota bacterium]